MKAFFVVVIIITFLIGLIIGIWSSLHICIHLYGVDLVNSRLYSDKHLAIMKVFRTWIGLMQRGDNVTSIIKRSDINSVAIYGVGFLGECLLNEFEQTGVEVAYVIDNNGNAHKNYKVYNIEDELPDVDLVIVTPVEHSTSLVLKLGRKVKGKVITLKKLVSTEYIS